MPAIGFYFQVGYEQKVNDIERIVRLINNDSPTLGVHRHELPRLDADSTTVGEMEHESVKWLRVVKFTDFFNRHSGFDQKLLEQSQAMRSSAADASGVADVRL